MRAGGKVRWGFAAEGCTFVAFNPALSNSAQPGRRTTMREHALTAMASDGEEWRGTRVARMQFPGAFLD